MIVLSNASPLITLARIGQLAKLPSLFESVRISGEVYKEIVVDGAGMPGALAVKSAAWIRVTPVLDSARVISAGIENGLGVGETSAVQLAIEMNLPVVLMDERRGRRFAKEQGLDTIGCVGLLEALFRRGELLDLRGAYLDLVAVNARVDSSTLGQSLEKLGLPKV